MRKLYSIGGSGLLALSGALLTAGLGMFITPQTYESVARVALKPSGTNEQRSVELELARWQSTAMLHDVITNLNLSQKWGARFKLEPLPMDVTEKMLRAQLKVKAARESVVEIRAESEEPTEAAAIANALVEANRRALTPGDAKTKIVERKSPGNGPTEKVLEWPDPPLSILEKAVPNLRPVRPHPLVKMLVPFAGLLTGLLGVVVLFLGVSRS